MAHLDISRIGRRTSPTGRPGFWKTLRQLIGLQRSRAHLKALDDHLLDDIGISSKQAKRESQRPLWDVPDHWKR